MVSSILGRNLPDMKYFYFTLLILLAVSCTSQEEYPTLEENTMIHRDESLKPFYHGVASGDPYAESVLLWTRVSPETQLPEIKVTWEVAEDANFSAIVTSGSTTTGPEKDYTVKVEAIGLAAGTVYHYRFMALDGTSMTGKTMTAAEETSQLNFAVVSCSNYEWGYFNAYGRIAEEENLNAVIHLGDYIYEYGTDTYGDTTIGRINIPTHEIISLQDYRDRYSLYRLDPDLIAAHASHPFIVIWDDHEIANNSYVDGAQNHQDDEGSYLARKTAARKAYYEWLPIRDTPNHYREFKFGELADLFMLDERLAGRTKPADSLGDPSLLDENRTLLGQEQFNWLEENLKSSKAKWKLIGNQVIYSYLNWGYETFNINLDSWDGYPQDQEKLASVIKDNEIENVIFITGDTHSAWAFEVTNQPFDEYDPETSEGAFALEFGTTSINSSNANERYSTDTVLLHEQKITNSEINPHLKYSNLRDHGYLLLRLTDEKVIANYKFVETLRERNSNVRSEIILEAMSGSVKLKKAKK